MKNKFSHKIFLGLLFTFLMLTVLAFQAIAADSNSVLKVISQKYTSLTKDVKDLTIEQVINIVSSGNKVTSTSKTFKKGNKFRVDSSTQLPGGAKGSGNLDTTIIYDGKDMWMISSFTGKKKLSANEIRQYQNEKDWLGLASERAKILGSELVNGRDCYIAEIAGDSETGTTRLWIAKDTLAVLKGETKPSKGETVSWISSNFQKLKGNWEIPFKTDIYLGNKLTTTTTVTSFEINKGLSDELFDPNKVKVKSTNLGVFKNLGGFKKK